MSARAPTRVQLSLGELARHGGLTGKHRDGWGVAFYDGPDALVVREPEPASDSTWMRFVREHPQRSSIVVAHIRLATRGARALRNTQPFSRELGGRVHAFGHNGTLAGLEPDRPPAGWRFRPIGDTDSELAFCALLERMRDVWRSVEGATPELAERLAAVTDFARWLRARGPANFLYADGDTVFAHAHRRTQADGVIRPPGLHLLCRTCTMADDAPLAGLTLGDGTDGATAQEVALVASVPLSDEAWQPLPEGEVLALREGRVVARVAAVSQDR